MRTFLQYLREESHTETVVIYPGRFQPAHKNHANVYLSIKQHMPNATVYISTTNDVKENSPFSFVERMRMLVAAGVPDSQIILCKNPYVANEIKQMHTLNNTKMIFAVGSKDMLPESPRFSIGLKKNGEPTYMQLSTPQEIYSITQNHVNSMQTADKHAYVAIAPTLTFTLKVGSNNMSITGATQIRQIYREASVATRKSIISQLYNGFKEDIYNLFNDKLT